MEYKDANDRVIIDYIRADMIYPLSWDNGDVTEMCIWNIKDVRRKRSYLSATASIRENRGREKMMSSITS